MQRFGLWFLRVIVVVYLVLGLFMAAYGIVGISGPLGGPVVDFVIAAGDAVLAIVFWRRACRVAKR